MKANSIMQRVLERRESAAAAVAMPAGLARAMECGVELDDECVVLRGSRTARDEDTRRSLLDRTGYECFVNHLHFTERVKTTALSQAEEFCRRMTPLLRQADRQAEFRFIISARDCEWTVRFHGKRSGENWVSDNLESYSGEAVMVVDAAELVPFQPQI